MGPSAGLCHCRESNHNSSSIERVYRPELGPLPVRPQHNMQNMHLFGLFNGAVPSKQFIRYRVLGRVVNADLERIRKETECI
jgi:hypothetical protein